MVVFFTHSERRAFDLIHWQIHPCSDGDSLPSRLPPKTVHSLEKRGQAPPRRGQKQPQNCSFKRLVDNFRIQATLRVFFLAWLRVLGNTMPKATLQIRVIQPTGVLPKGSGPWGCQRRGVPSVLLPSDACLFTDLISGLLPCPLP